MTTAAVLAAVLVIAGAALGLSSLLGSSSPGHHPAASPGPVASATTSGFPTAPAVPTVPTVPAVPTVPTNPQPQSSTTTSPQTTPVTSTPTVNWLGMLIATQPPGAAVVQTVRIGTEADRAGINPGEIIQAVNGRPIRSAQGIAAAVKGLARGTHVTLALAYGSGSSAAELTLGAPPSVTP